MKKFSKVFEDFLKLDIINVQKRKAKNTFGKNIHFFCKIAEKKALTGILSSPDQNYFFGTNA